jgi:predicted methyltransferase
VLVARAQGAMDAAISPDLGLSTVEVNLTDAGVHFPAGAVVRWEDVEQIAESANACFQVEDEAIRPIRVFSEVTGWARTLYPTQGAPTMLVSGVLMHRIKGTDPHRDTLNKIRSVAPVVGPVLDTATGLGYTAIEAARTAEAVTTVELDPASLVIARLNPWSRELFDNPRITQVVGDVWDVAEEAPDGSFSRVIHDPPAFSLAGDLYSGDFYRELHRVLARRGILYHYVGDPDSKSGRSVTAGVVRRLQAAGFARVVRKPQAFGVVAYKS